MSYMRRLLNVMCLGVVLLAGCGGSRTSITGGGTTPPPVTDPATSITLVTSLPQIPSDGGKSATITALAKDAQNQFVQGVAVAFTASSGGLAVTQGTTDVNGQATATLSAAGDPTNRTITVTATAGTTSATIPVQVTGTKLSVTGPANLVQNGQGSYSIALVDAGGNGIPNQTVTLASSAGNTLSATTVTTNATGQVTFTLTAVNSGTDTITATSLGQQAAQTVVISSESFNFTAPAANAQVNLGQTATLTVTWTSAGAPQVGQTVNFSATRGTLSAASAVVSASGTASVTISSTTAGPSVISASGSGVTAQVIVNFVATTPTSIAVQASPATIVTQGQSTITATVRDANNNLVQGQTVDFSITQDSTGGSLSVASGTTNVQGQASTVYTASTTTSADKGVIITAKVQGYSVSGSAPLTVGGQTIFLSLGTGNLITEYSTTQYSIPYSVQAIDAAGNGVNNVAVTYTVTSLAYVKGFLKFPTGGSSWSLVQTTASNDPDVYVPIGYGCNSEDLNNNGILDPGEDYNKNGKLDPGLVVSTDVGSGVTATNGSASLNLIYPKDHSYYVYVRLTATGTVNGTQSSTSTDFLLPGAAADYDNATVAPPGPVSPYGTGTTCSNPN
jgi:hypothetical protein